MNKPAKEIAEEIISGTRLIDREVVYLAYELAKAVIREAASSEPVAWRYRVKDDPRGWELFEECPFAEGDSPGPNEELQPLYTHPSISLSDEDIRDIVIKEWPELLECDFECTKALARAIEAKLKGKE